MAIIFTMTVVCLEVKQLIIEDTVQNLIDSGRFQDEAAIAAYRYHLSRASASLIVEEWEISKKRREDSI